MQTDKKLAEKQEKIKQELINCNKEYQEAISDSKRFRFEIEVADKKLKTIRAEDERNSKNLLIIQKKKARLMREEEEIRRGISEEEFDRKVEEMFAKQKPFWECLETQIIATQKEANEYMAGLGEPLSPDKAIAKFKQYSESNTFGGEAMRIRGMKQQHEAAIRHIIRRKIEGEFISSLDMQRPNYLINDFLFEPTIEPLWNTQ